MKTHTNLTRKKGILTNIINRLRKRFSGVHRNIYVYGPNAQRIREVNNGPVKVNNNLDKSNYFKNCNM